MLGGGSALTTPDLAAPSLLPQERLKPSALVLLGRASPQRLFFRGYGGGAGAGGGKQTRAL